MIGVSTMRGWSGRETTITGGYGGGLKLSLEDGNEPALEFDMGLLTSTTWRRLRIQHLPIYTLVALAKCQWVSCHSIGRLGMFPTGSYTCGDSQYHNQAFRFGLFPQLIQPGLLDPEAQS
jgi:hypothetical protein